MNKIKLDETDRDILDMLIDNTRIPFTDIGKKLLVSAATVHLRVKKMEEQGIIKGSRLLLDYKKLEHSFIIYVGVFLNKTSEATFVLERINQIPYVVTAHLTAGKFTIFCEVRVKSPKHAKEIIFTLGDIEGVRETESMVCLEEGVDDEKQLMHAIVRSVNA